MSGPGFSFDAQATVNPGRFLSALVIEELMRQGLGLVVACPGGRNQPLLGALAVRDDLTRVRAVDERAAGHLALGWLRGRLAAGEAPALAAVVTTSGSAPLLVAPALAEARAAGLPLVLLSADRPAELHDVGANQTLDQVSPLAPFARWQVTLPCYAGGAGPHDVLGATAEAAAMALGPPAGPVQLDLAFREPLAPDPEPLPADWLPRVAGWAAAASPYAWRRGPAGVPASAVDRLRAELAAATRPLVLVAGLSAAGDRDAAFAIAERSGAPWVADAGSGLRLRPASTRRLDHAGFQVGRLRECDLVLQLGHRPVSLPLTRALAAARRWLVCDHPDRQDPCRQGGAQLASTPRDLLAAVADHPLLASPSPDWVDDLVAADAAWRESLAGHVEATGDALTEAWVVREVARRLGPDHGLLLGNSLPVRHLDTVAAADRSPDRGGDDAGPCTLTSRGTSGIEGLVAQAVGAATGLRRPTIAVLGDVTVQHDLGSLALLAQEGPPLLVLVIENGGGGIFRQLPGGRHPDLLDPWLTAHHDVDLCAVARAHGLFTRRVRHRGGLANALTDFVRRPEPTLLAAVVPPHGHARLLAALREEAP